MKSCGLALAVDGTEDDLISCFKEGKKGAEGRALSGEDMATAAPSSNIIEEDDDDDDYIDLEII